MIPRGKPFPKGPETRLYCPACLLDGRDEILRPLRIFSLAPEDRRDDSPSTPFVRYTCEATGCGYVEVHTHVLTSLL